MNTKDRTTTLSEKYQISVPKAIRERQKWKPGQKLSFVEWDGQVFLVPVPSLDQLEGIMVGADPTGFRDRDDRY